MAYAFVSLDVEFTTQRNGLGNSIGFNNFSNISNFNYKSFNISGINFIDALTINTAGNYMISWTCQPFDVENQAFNLFNLANSESISGASFSIYESTTGDNLRQTHGNIILNLKKGDILNLSQTPGPSGIEFIQTNTNIKITTASLTAYLIPSTSPFANLINNSTSSVSNDLGNGTILNIGDNMTFNNNYFSQTSGGDDFTLINNNTLISNISSSNYFSFYNLNLYESNNYNIYYFPTIIYETTQSPEPPPPPSPIQTFSTLFNFTLSQNEYITFNNSEGISTFSNSSTNQESTGNNWFWYIYSSVCNQIIGNNLLNVEKGDTFNLKCYGSSGILIMDTDTDAVETAINGSIVQNQMYGSIPGTNASLTLLPLTSNYAYATNNISQSIDTNDFVNFNNFQTGGTNFSSSDNNQIISANTSTCLIFFTITIFQTSNLVPNTTTAPTVSIQSGALTSPTIFTFSNQFDYYKNNTYTISGTIITSVPGNETIRLVNLTSVALNLATQSSSSIPLPNEAITTPVNMPLGMTPINASLFVMQL